MWDIEEDLLLITLFFKNPRHELIYNDYVPSNNRLRHPICNPSRTLYSWLCSLLTQAQLLRYFEFFGFFASSAFAWHSDFFSCFYRQSLFDFLSCNLMIFILSNKDTIHHHYHQTSWWAGIDWVIFLPLFFNILYAN